MPLPYVMISVPTLPTGVSEEAAAEPEVSIPAPSCDLDPSTLIPVTLPGADQDNSQILPWVQPPMVWKDYVIIDRYGPPLPVERCCVCNEPAHKTLRKTFSSSGSNTLFLVLLIPILLPLAVVTYFLEQCRASVEVGICHRCANRRMLGITMGIALLIASVPLFVNAFLAKTDAGFLWGIGAAMALLVGALVTAYSLSLGQPKRVDKRWVILKLGGKKFRQSLPPSPVPQF